MNMNCWQAGRVILAVTVMPSPLPRLGISIGGLV
jgi:hypothetical protein